jgi:TonB family protein
MRFVLVDPKMDLEALRAPERAPASDKNREARSPAPTPVPAPEPLSRGNTPERVERTTPEAARGNGPAPDSPAAAPEPPAPPSPNSGASPPKVAELESPIAPPAAPAGGRVPAGGALGDALRNLQRYVKPEQFDGGKGAAQFGPFQFDTKGVEFGPWIRRFAQQVKNNWDPLIPNGPLMLRQKGHVVITLNVHKNGSITDVAVAAPCPIPGFNTAAFGALTASNPTLPLPPEYPDEKVFFTITFYYNERPPDQ